MKVRRLVTWPFIAFLFGYGAPTNDPTVASSIDQVLSSTVTGGGLAILVGLPLALIFRRGEKEIGARALIPMCLALASAVILDPLGLGLVGAAFYVLCTRTRNRNDRRIQPGSQAVGTDGVVAATPASSSVNRWTWLPFVVLATAIIFYAAATLSGEEEAPPAQTNSSAEPDFETWSELSPMPSAKPIR